MEPKTPYSIDD